VCQYIIYRILLWIQDDKELKKCYLELLEFIQPYYNMLLSQKNEFQTVMLTNVLQILKEMPKEKVYSMPVTLNIPYLAVRLKEELDSYNLENTEQQYHCHGLHAFFRLNEMRVMIGLDSSTMNGIIFLFRSSEAPYIRLLSARQIDSMIRQIALKLKEIENIYCRLFAEKMMDELYSLLSLTEKTEVVE